MKTVNIKCSDEVDNSDKLSCKILIFTEGTILKPNSIFQHFNHAAYIPIGNSASKINDWHKQGAQIVYLTSTRREKHIASIAGILEKYDFAPGILLCREADEKYRDIVEAVRPDILIEDDCKSIGGEWQMAITYVKPEIKHEIKSIVVKEFRGIDHLHSAISDL